MENRNYYSLHCLQMETQLIHANLDILYDILGDMTKIQAKAHGDVSFFTQSQKSYSDAQVIDAYSLSENYSADKL